MLRFLSSKISNKLNRTSSTCRRFGVADDFAKEVQEIRKELYPVLKQAKRDHETAFSNVEKLITDKAVYRGPETKNFTLYRRIMDNN